MYVDSAERPHLRVSFSEDKCTNVKIGQKRSSLTYFILGEAKSCGSPLGGSRRSKNQVGGGGLLAAKLRCIGCQQVIVMLLGGTGQLRTAERYRLGRRQHFRRVA